MTNMKIKQERERMERIGYVDVHDLCRECLVELKQNYMTMLADEGMFEQIMGVNYGEPSMLDLVEADSLIPDSSIFYHYKGVGFVPDDFFCLMETEE